jgi:hypothetical protein
MCFAFKRRITEQRTSQSAALVIDTVLYKALLLGKQWASDDSSRPSQPLVIDLRGQNAQRALSLEVAAVSWNLVDFVRSGLVC